LKKNASERFVRAACMFHRMKKLGQSFVIGPLVWAKSSTPKKPPPKKGKKVLKKKNKYQPPPFDVIQRWYD